MKRGVKSIPAALFLVGRRPAVRFVPVMIAWLFLVVLRRVCRGRDGGVPEGPYHYQAEAVAFESCGNVRTFRQLNPVRCNIGDFTPE